MTHSASSPTDPWPGVFDLGTIALFNGSPNAGKTALIAGMLQRLAEGGDLFGFTVQPTPVFFFAMDRLWKKGAATWFERYGFNIPHYSFVDDLNTIATWFREKTRMPWDAYTTLVEQQHLAPGTLLAADPFENAWGNVMDRAQVITASTVLQRYLQQTRVAQLGIMHSGKIKGDSGLNYANVHEQMAGSGTLSGYSSAQLTLLAPKQTGAKDGLYHLHITAHCLPAMIFGLARDTEGRFLIDNYIRLDEHTQLVALTQELPPDQRAALVQFPADGPISTETIVTVMADKYKRTKVFEILNALATAGYIVRVAHGYWQRTEKAKAYLQPEPPA